MSEIIAGAAITLVVFLILGLLIAGVVTDLPCFDALEREDGDDE